MTSSRITARNSESADRVTNRDVETTYEALKRQIAQLGFVRPGSLVRRFMPCGRAGCRCMADPPALHGPYYQWTHKVHGKTVTRRLSNAQAQHCEEWIRNHHQLKKILRRMEALSLKVTDRALREIPES